MNRYLSLIVLLCLNHCFSLAQHTDGPYIWHDSVGSGALVVTVLPDGAIQKTRIESLPSDYQFTVKTEDEKHCFDVQLHKVERPAATYPEASKTFIMSDPHGNFDCFQALLRAGGVIDDQYHWTFADGHLVVIGDVMDRGVDVLPIYWLIYQLEGEAQKTGGHVSFLLGNHEPMVLMSDNRYTKEKYIALADSLQMPCGMLFGPTTELGKWLTTRNTMMKIGRNLFVHAGLSPAFYELNLSLDTVNKEMSKGLYVKKKDRKEISELVHTLYASDGPIWYRGLVRKDKKYNPAPSDSLQMILDRYEADRLYVGHTIFKRVSKFYDGKVVGVNVDNAKARKKNRPRAILIKDGKAYLVKDSGVTKKYY